MRNLRLDLCYDGTRYRGWQRLQNCDNTIQQKLETALSRILGEPITVIGSGRTDAGVHAMHQVANFHCESAMPAHEILRELRQYLPEDIGILSCKEASQRFHARLNALQKTYCYRVWNSEDPCVFQRRFVHTDPRPLDLSAMEAAVEHLLGTHDFGCFCAVKMKNKSTVRCIHRICIERVGQEVRFSVTGNGFLHHMVRILVGTLLEVGRGERDADSIALLLGGKRSNAGALVPGKGLCLMEVTY